MGIIKNLYTEILFNLETITEDELFDKLQKQEQYLALQHLIKKFPSYPVEYLEQELLEFCRKSV